MDPVGLVAVILLFGGGTLFLLSISPIGKAVAARILGRKTALPDDEEVAMAFSAQMKELREELEAMRHSSDEQTAELAERVDFLERMLAKQREADRLPPVR
jgi:hypothetical protein